MHAASGCGRRRLLGVVAIASIVTLACGEQVPTAGDAVDGGMKLRIVSGEAQSGVVGAELSEPLVVQALSTSGAALAGQIVNFRVVEGGGGVFAGASITDGSGYAREWWTLGPAVGLNRIEARAVHPTTGERLVFAEFSATGLTSVPAASVVVTPATSTLAVGGTLQLAARVTDANGNVLQLPVSWTSSSGAIASVSASGLVNATAAGAATITATSGGRSGTATITVSQPTVPPPSTGTSVFTHGFETGTLAEVWQDGLDPAKHRIVTDPTRAHSGSRFLEIRYPRAVEGAGGWLTRFFMPGYDSLRVSYWVQFPTNWLGGTYLLGLYANRTDNQWSGFGRAGRCPNGTDFSNHFLYAEYDGNPGDVTFYAYTMDMDRSDSCYGDRGAGRARYVGSRELTRGVWHRVELEVRLNTPGQANGWQRMYIDGTMRGEWTGMQQRSSNILKINALQLTANVTGGSPQDQALLIDDIVVSTLGSSTSTPPLPPPAPAPVATVTVSPSSATISIGATSTLSAALRDAAGATLTGRSVSWSSSAPSVASVSPTGVVTGISSGSARITATSEGRSGSASIAVSATTGGGGTGTVNFANEPAGMTRVTDWSFPTLNGSGWQYSTEQSSARITQDATAAGDPSVVEFLFPAGFTGGSAPGRVAPPRFSSGARELYWAFTFKANATWQGHSSTINKIGYGWQNGQTLWGLTWYWYGGTAAPNISLFDQGSGLKYFQPNMAQAVPIRAGEWHEVEVQYRPSSATGRPDGIVKIWVNGVLMTNYVNVVTTAGTINDIYFEPTWGGVGDTKRANDNMRFGQARVSIR